MGLEPGPASGRKLPAAILAGAVLAGLVPLQAGLGWFPPATLAQEGLDAFGRWEQTLRRCRITRWPAAIPSAATARPPAAAAHDCQRLRLDQQLEGLLVVRWVTATGGGRYATRQLAFAGVLDQGSPPMRCNAEGRCRPAGVMAVWVSVVAESGVNPGGLALGLPSTHRAQGLCRLEPRRFHCEATEPDGRRWLAEGSP